MKFKHHLDYGREILRAHKIKSKAFLIGCVLPDMNFVYPPHNVRYTHRRFEKKLKKTCKHIENNKTGILDMIRAGECMHYACDYFCYSHNNHSYGLPHKRYETGYFEYYNSENKKDSNILKSINKIIKLSDEENEEITSNNLESDILNNLWALHRYYIKVSDIEKEKEKFSKLYKQYKIDTTLRREFTSQVFYKLLLEIDKNTKIN